jgi:hypothetical protein
VLGNGISKYSIGHLLGNAISALGCMAMMRIRIDAMPFVRQCESIGLYLGAPNRATYRFVDQLLPLMRSLFINNCIESFEKSNGSLKALVGSGEQQQQQWKVSDQEQ